MTPNEITTLIASGLNEELNMPFKLMMLDRVNYWRETLIRRSLDKDPRERKFFRQTLWIPMNETNEVLCAMPYTQCLVARVKEPIPTPLRANGILFDYVGSVNGMNAFQNQPATNIPLLLQGKYSASNIYYDWVNNDVIVYGNSKLPMVRIDGIFANPIAVMKYNCKSVANGCDYWEEQYPCSGDIIQAIVQYILQVDYNRAPQNAPTKEIPVIEQTDKP